MINGKYGRIFFASILLLFAVPRFAPHAMAENNKTRNEKADSLREKAETKAKGRLDYPDVYDFFNRGEIFYAQDYSSLSRQIQQLAIAMQAFARELKSVPAPSAQIGVNPPDPSALRYGPKGPTAKSVRLILEYRLLIEGNPRLKVGKVTEDHNQVDAQIVTLEGSLVEEFRVDKKTGRWTPAH